MADPIDLWLGENERPMPAKGYVSNLLGGLLSGFYGTPNPAAPSVLENLADAQTYNNARNYGEMAMAGAIAAPFLAQGAMGGAMRLDRAMSTPKFQAGFNRLMDNNPRLAEGLTALQSPSQIFVGQNSKLWNADNESLFRRLEKEGKSREEIYKQTLTMRLGDGTLRQEVPDGDFRINPRRLLQGDGAYEAAYAEKFREMHGRDYDPMQKDNLTVKQAKELDDAARQGLAESRSAYHLIDHGPVRRGYPSLMNVDVEARPEAHVASGSFLPRGGVSGEGKIMVGTKGLTDGTGDNYGDLWLNPRANADFNDTVMHELQHYLQSKDGTAHGSTVDTAKSSMRAQARVDSMRFPYGLRDLVDRKANYKQLSEANRLTRQRSAVFQMIRNEKITEARLEAIPGGKKILKQYAEKFPDDKTSQLTFAAGALYKDLGRRISKLPNTTMVNEQKARRLPPGRGKSMAKEYDEMMMTPGVPSLLAIDEQATRLSNMSPFAVYQNAYGELEARLAAHRRNMTEQQRRATFPLSRQSMVDSAGEYATPDSLRFLSEKNLWYPRTRLKLD